MHKFASACIWGHGRAAHIYLVNSSLTEACMGTSVCAVIRGGLAVVQEAEKELLHLSCIWPGEALNGMTNMKSIS